MRWAVVIYLIALIASWLLDKDHPLPLPLEGDWKEIPIDLSAEGEAGKHALLRYRKRPGTDGGRLPVLLIHGSPMASDSLDPLLRELPADRTYLVPDLPGFGYSRYGFTDYSFDGHAEALRHLLQTEGVESAHLVAYSQGATDGSRRWCIRGYGSESTPCGGRFAWSRQRPVLAKSPWAPWDLVLYAV